MSEYEIQRFTRHCAATGRELAPGEPFYSVLLVDQGELVRRDYSAAAWQGPPQDAIGWWRSQVPRPEAKRFHWAPNDVMLDFFEQLACQPGREDLRYVLALLLLRRRVLRMEREEPDPHGRAVLVAYCPRRETTYKVPVAVPDETRIDQIQDELARLLFAQAA
ncbi:MAG: hypothetical protein ACUVUC_06220 [Thermoguttaceae bacterium]